MGLFDINIEVLTSQITPDVFQKPRFLAFFYAFPSPLDWLSASFSAFRNGYFATSYSSITTYSVGVRVKYGTSIYECIQESTDNLPTDVNFWTLFVQNWTGVNDRAKYSSNRALFEYALNREFNGTFLQPDAAPRTINSDIYIRSRSVSGGFSIGLTESFSGSAGSTDGDTISETPIYGGDNFTVYVKDTLGITSGSDAEKILIAFIDKYKAIQKKYSIVYYS
jgi:hypothetical protein